MMKFISLFLCATLLLVLSSCSKADGVHNSYSEKTEISSTSKNLEGFFDYDLPEPYSLYNSGFPNQFIDWCNVAISDNSVYEQYNDNAKFIDYLRNNKKILLPCVDGEGFSFDHLILSTGKVGYEISYNKENSEKELVLYITAISGDKWQSDKKIIKETYNCTEKIKKQKLYKETYYVVQTDEVLKYYYVKNGFAVYLAYREYDYNNGNHRYMEIQDDIINIKFDTVEFTN